MSAWPGPRPAAVLSREESLAALVLRYFGSRGPATVRDCADWSGLTMTDVRKGLALADEIAPGAIVAASFNGAEFYLQPPESVGEAFGTGAASRPRRGIGGARAWDGRPQIDLVQCYDEYIMGYSVSRHYFGGTAPAYPFGDNPMHVVLLDGVMAGSWRHSLVRRGSAAQRCELDIRLSRPLGQELENALEAAGQVRGLPRHAGSPDSGGHLTSMRPFGDAVRSGHKDPGRVLRRV
jgi:hypothetical protein